MSFPPLSHPAHDVCKPLEALPTRRATPIPVTDTGPARLDSLERARRCPRMSAVHPRKKMYHARQTDGFSTAATRCENSKRVWRSGYRKQSFLGSSPRCGRTRTTSQRPSMRYWPLTSATSTNASILLTNIFQSQRNSRLSFSARGRHNVPKSVPLLN